MSSLIDSYGESNYSQGYLIYAGGHGGQSFQVSSAYRVTSCKFYLAEYGTISGNLYAELYNVTGTYGTSSHITGSPLATSSPIDSAILSTTPTLYEFTFPVGSQYGIPPGDYAIVVTGLGSSPNGLNLGADGTSPTHGGNFAYNNGSISSTDCIFYVYGDPIPPPVADFIGNPTNGFVGPPVTFTDLSTNTPTSWAWDFGDSSTSTSQNPSHTYTSAGTYAVTLIATNDGGSDTETKTNYMSITVPRTFKGVQSTVGIGSITF